MTRPSPVLTGSTVVLRRWAADDAPELLRVVTESQPHLRPWMAWAAGEYTADSAREFLAEAATGWDVCAKFSYAITIGGRIVGGTSLMAHIGPHAFEIGYWLHPASVGRGRAREAVSLLVAAGFALPHIDYIEIAHDTANARSGAIPKALGFTEHARVSPPQEPVTSAEDGVDLRWRLTRRDRE